MRFVFFWKFWSWIFLFSTLPFPSRALFLFDAAHSPSFSFSQLFDGALEGILRFSFLEHKKKARSQTSFLLLLFLLSSFFATREKKKKNTTSYWAVLLLRILAFVLPVYLIFQACLTFRRYRVASGSPARVSYGATRAAGGAAARRGSGGSERRRGRSRHGATAAATTAETTTAETTIATPAASVEPATEAGTTSAPRRGDEAV